jgi:hypothetical protein
MHASGRFDPFAKPTMNFRCLREPDIADRGPGRRSWAGSAPVALGRTGVRAIAAVPLRARNSSRSLETASRRPKAYLRHPNSSCASAISGISGVGKKPSSAGARTARASFRRPVASQSLASEYEAMSA